MLMFCRVTTCYAFAVARSTSMHMGKSVEESIAHDKALSQAFFHSYLDVCQNFTFGVTSCSKSPPISKVRITTWPFV